MTLPWLRLYSEFATDPKIQILAFEDQRHFVMLLCLKGNGTLDAEAPSDPYRERLIAKALGLDLVAAQEAKRRLVEGGLITPDWQPRAWEARQFKSDHDATERKRKQREKQRLADHGRDSHNDVTTSGCDSHGLDTDTDTDADTDSEPDSEPEKDPKGEARSARPRTRKKTYAKFSRKVPYDFTPDAEHALTEIPDLDVEREIKKFRDWEFNPPRKDWAAVWRGWIARSRDTGRYARRVVRAPTVAELEAQEAQARAKL